MINSKNRFVNFFVHKIQHYDHELYWKRRAIVVDPNAKCSKIKKLFYLFYIKKCDAFNLSSFGTDINSGAKIASPPILYHGLNGIVVSHFAIIGKECVIFQRVTISEGKEHKAPIIGDRCLIGTGAVILGDIKIGNDVRIGANSVMVDDVPDNCTDVGVPARIVKRNEVKENDL